jgi:hypothetical protein
MWKVKISLVCLLPVLLCGAESTVRRNAMPLIGVVRFITASNAATDINNAEQIRVFIAKSIEVSEKFRVIDVEMLDEFMLEQDILPLKLYRPEEMRKIPPGFAQFLVTGFVSVEKKSYRVRIHLLDLAKQEFLFSEETLIGGVNDVNEITSWDDVRVFAKRFLEQAERIIPIDTTEQEEQYRIGDMGPAGGIIFYIRNSDVDGWRYLEAAPPQTEFRAPWGIVFSDGLIVPSFLATKTDLGTGRENTADIIDHFQIQGPAIAAQLCRSFNYGGYTDWFLPSKDELVVMYTNLAANGLGGFRREPYWSSTESSYRFAFFQSFREGKQFFNGEKTMPMYVRAIRAF